MEEIPTDHLYEFSELEMSKFTEVCKFTNRRKQFESRRLSEIRIGAWKYLTKCIEGGDFRHLTRDVTITYDVARLYALIRKEAGRADMTILSALHFEFNALSLHGEDLSTLLQEATDLAEQISSMAKELKSDHVIGKDALTTKIVQEAFGKSEKYKLFAHESVIMRGLEAGMFTAPSLVAELHKLSKQVTAAVSGNRGIARKAETPRDGPARRGGPDIRPTSVIVHQGEACRNFEQGKCRFGNNCKYDHIDKDGKTVHVGQKDSTATAGDCSFCKKSGHSVEQCFTLKRAEKILESRVKPMDKAKVAKKEPRKKASTKYTELSEDSSESSDNSTSTGSTDFPEVEKPEQVPRRKRVGSKPKSHAKSATTAYRAYTSHRKTKGSCSADELGDLQLHCVTQV